MLGWKRNKGQNKGRNRGRSLPRGRNETSKSNPLSQRFSRVPEPPTLDMNEMVVDDTPAPVMSEQDEPETTIFTETEVIEQDDPMRDPPVGWLVVVGGPGKGHFVTIRYGSNNIGRGEDQRIILNFGDTGISRSNHAIVSYDKKSRRYFVQHGGGQNLTYLHGEPLLTPKELNDGDLIILGNTSLRFTPLCSKSFEWTDLDEAEKAH